jgi:hypothetical protein
LRIDAIWYEGIRGKCQKMRIGKGLPASITTPTTTVARNPVDLVDMLDQQIRRNLECLWQLHHPIRISDDATSASNRRSKWRELYDMHDFMKEADPNCSNADVCAAYNKRYPNREPATLKVLRNHKAHLSRKNKCD